MENPDAHIILPGRPITKKNHQQIVRTKTKKSSGFRDGMGGNNYKSGQSMSVDQYKQMLSGKKSKNKSSRPYVIQSEQYRNYEEECLMRLNSYSGPLFRDDKLHVKILYWLPNKRGWPDLTGLIQSSWDILEKAKIIDNDKNIVNPDGTRLVGVDSENPRAEIFIKKVKYSFEDDRRK